MTGAEVVAAWRESWLSVGWVIERGDWKPGIMEDLEARIDAALHLNAAESPEQVVEGAPADTAARRAKGKA